MIKFASVLLALAASISAAEISLSWKPGPTATQDRVTGYLLEHAGENGAFTNFCGIAAFPTACVVSNLCIGLHQFRLHNTNAYGVGDSFVSVSTNLVWKPGSSPESLTIDSVTQNSITLTLQLKP